MDTPLPPVPPDLWPPVLPATSIRKPGHGLFVEVAPSLENPLLGILSTHIHIEMQCAGEWAARTEPVSTEKGMISPQTISRQCAERATRLLSIYSNLYSAAHSLGDLDRAPDALKATATQCYQRGFRNEREYQRRQAQGITYNDDLYEKVNPDALEALITKPSHRSLYR